MGGLPSNIGLYPLNFRDLKGDKLDFDRHFSSLQNMFFDCVA